MVTEATLYVVTKSDDDSFVELLRVLTYQEQAEAFREEARRADPRYDYYIHEVPFGWDGTALPTYVPPPPRPLSPVERMLMEGTIAALKESMKNTGSLLRWIDDAHPNIGNSVTVRLPQRYGGGDREGR